MLLLLKRECCQQQSRRGKTSALGEGRAARFAFRSSNIPLLISLQIHSEPWKYLLLCSNHFSLFPVPPRLSQYFTCHTDWQQHLHLPIGNIVTIIVEADSRCYWRRADWDATVASQSASYPSAHKQQDRSSRPPSSQSSALMRLSPSPRNGNPVTLRCTSVPSATQRCSVSDLTGQRCCLHIKQYRSALPAATNWVGSTQKHTGRDIHIRSTAAQAKQEITGNNFGNKLRKCFCFYYWTLCDFWIVGETK